MRLEKKPPLSISWFAAVACALALFVDSPAAPARSQQAEVDRTVVLVIGPLQVSAYRVAKNFNQFRNPPGRADQPVNPPEARRWFSQFIDRQVLIAHAIALGYGERDFVRRELARMERHMLTSPRGPYYEEIFSAHPAAASADHPGQDNDSKVYQLQIARVPQSAPIVAGLSLEAHSLADGATLFAQLQDSGEAEIFKGLISWPFTPFDEIGSSLDHATLGEWLRISDSDSILLYQVVTVGLSAPPGERAVPLRPSPLAPAELERRLVREHQQEVLNRSRWQFDWVEAGKVVEILARTPPDPAQSIGAEALELLKDLRLGRYSQGAAVLEIRGADYIEYHNRQFVRRLPRRKLDVYNDIRSFVIESQNYAAAHTDRLLLQPKFSEDRENYRNNLILEAFEKDHFSHAASGDEDSANRRAQLARQLQAPAGFTIEDHIDYEKFGLAKDGPAFTR